MDRFIQKYYAVEDGDLMLCETNGVAYQKDMTVTAKYDAAYWGKYACYAGSATCNAIHSGRVGLVNRYCGSDSYVLDVGIGCGEFIRSRPSTFGTDVNPAAIKWLNERGLIADDVSVFAGITFWDVLEHIVDPGEYLSRVRPGAFIFASIPVFDDLRRVRESKHYRPGEHMYYFTERGFIGWVCEYGFSLLEISDVESVAGRDSIKSFVFRKDV